MRRLRHTSVPTRRPASPHPTITRAYDFSAHGDILALPIGLFAEPSYYKRH